MPASFRLPIRVRRSASFAAFALTLLAAVTTPGRAQWLEDVISLPDTLAGVRFPCSLYYSPRCSVLVGGGYDSLLVGIVPSEMGVKYRVRLPHEARFLAGNPDRDMVYAAARYQDTIWGIDCATGSILAAIPARGGSYTLYNPASRKLYLAGERQLTIVDADADSVLRIMNSGGRLDGMCLDPAGSKLYVAGWTDSTVAVIDGAGDTLRGLIEFPNDPRALVAVPTGNKVYCKTIDRLVVVDARADTITKVNWFARSVRHLAYSPHTDRVFGLASSDREIYAIDASTDSIVHWLRFGRHPVSILVHPVSGLVYCADDDDNDIKVLNASGDSVLTVVPLRYAPGGLEVDADHHLLWISGSMAGGVFAVSETSHAVTGEVVTAHAVYALGYNPTDNRLYCPAYGLGTMVTVDGITGQVLAVADLPRNPDQVCVVGPEGKVYVSHDRDDSLTVFDCASGQVSGRIKVGSGPGKLVYNAASSKVYCINQYIDSTVSVIDAGGDSVVATVTVGRTPDDIVCDSALNKVWCASSGSRILSVIDGETDSILASIPLGRPPYHLGVNPTTRKVYCTEGESDSLTVVDAVTNQLITRSLVGDAPGEVVWSLSSNKAYVRSTNALFVVDGRTDTVAKMLLTPPLPCFLSHNPVQDRLYVGLAGESFSQVWILDCASDSFTHAVEVPGTLYGTAWNPSRNRTYFGQPYQSALAVLRDSMPSGVSDVPGPGARESAAIASLVRGQLVLRGSREAALLDISGRKVADLKPGENDIRHVAPGVYFVGQKEGKTTTKVVVQR